MRERPILMSGPMVRAILEGRKTQTRRVVKGMALTWLESGFAPSFVALPENYLSPYGYAGDRLWVKETWQYANWTEDGDPFVRYAADRAVICHDDTPEDWTDRLTNIWADLSEEGNYAIDGTAADRRWRPSIFLPRWASRIKLEITGVRVERLADISEADALAEGVVKVKDACHVIRGVGYDLVGLCHTSAVTPFQILWDELNGSRGFGFDANPWVWVISFRPAPAPILNETREGDSQA